MNYFELFQMPVRLQPDKAELRCQYLLLSRRYHPDHHAQDSAAEQQEALESSALLNKAFRTLGSRDETIAYVLSLKSLLGEEGKQVLPPAFLMEMMDVNEAIADLDPGDSAGVAAMREGLARQEEELFAPVREVIESWQEGSGSDAALAQVRDYYLKKKYLDRLRQQLEGML